MSNIPDENAGCARCHNAGVTCLIEGEEHDGAGCELEPCPDCSTPARRVRALLDVYPHFETNNLDPEEIYTYWANGRAHTLRWSDLDELVKIAEAQTEPDTDYPFEM